MKKLLLFALTALAVVGCQKVDLDGDTVPTLEEKPTKAFTFHVKGDFQTNYTDMTRAAVRLEEKNDAGVTDLWVLDYVDGAYVQQVHQTSTQTGITFGSVPMQLAYGHHDIKFIASKGSDPSLTASALSWSKVHDTFVLDYPVDVVASSNGNRAPELKRAVGGIAVVATDKVPTNAKEIRFTSLRSLSLSLPTLSVVAPAEHTVTMTFPASWAGSSNNTMSTYTLLGDEDMTTDLRVEVVATDGSTISDFVIEDVVVRKNRITRLTGEVFGRGAGFSVSIDNSWDAPLEVDF